MNSLLLRARRAVTAPAFGLLLVLLCGAASADTKSFRIDAKNAAAALMEFGRQAGREVFFGYEHVKGFTTNAVQGDYEPLEALRLLVKDTGLSVSEQASGILVVEPKQTAGKDDKARTQPQQTGTTAMLPVRLARAEGDPSAAASSAGMAQDRARVPADVAGDEEMLVTGSRLKRTDMEGPAPVFRMTREDIERAGVNTMAELARQLPFQANSINDFVGNGNVGTGQSNINLRGLGNGSTLTLVNGRRFAMSGNSRIDSGNVYNLNSIPLAAIDRIEILKDGASAVYGSDAVAGVVNIILRHDYDGIDVNLSYGNTLKSDAAVTSASLTAGFLGSKGSAIFTLEHYDQDPLEATARSFSASADQRSRGGLDVRQSPGIRGTVFALPGQTLPGVTLPNGQPATFAAIPANQNGTTLTPASFNATAGVRDTMNQNAFMWTIPERRTLNIVGLFDYELASAVKLFAQVAYSHTDSSNHQATIAAYQGQLLVPAANPFNPFDQDVYVEKGLHTEIGNGGTNNKYHDFGTVVGLRGALPRDWEWEAAYTYSQSATDNISNLYNGNTGQLNAGFTNPAQAFNWFGDPSTTTVNSAAVIDTLRGNNLGAGLGKLSLIDASVRGELWQLPAGPVQAIFGGEMRKDHYEQAYVSDSRPPGFSFTGVIQELERENTALFAETEIPLVAAARGIRGIHDLKLSLAARYEDSREFGTTTDPRVGIRWQPVSQLLLRASYGTSFRGPTANESGDPIPFTTSVTDPRRGNEVVTVPALEQTIGLGPETSNNYSAGLVFEPEWVRGLSVSVDYYRIDYSDKFSFVFPQIALQYESLFGGAFITRGTPTPADTAAGRPGQITAVRQGFTNAASVRIEGIDFDIRSSWKTGIGEFNYYLLASYSMNYDEVATPGVPAIERVGTYRFPTEWRGTTSLFWSSGPLAAGLTLRYVGGYTNDGFGSFNPPRSIDALKEMDVQTSYQFSATTKAVLGINNVTDEDPPFAAAPFFYIGNFGYDTSIGSPRKAYYYFNLKKQF